MALKDQITQLKNDFDAVYRAGHNVGYTEGEEAGYAAGDSAGYARGKTDGKTEGYDAGVAASQQKVDQAYNNFWDAFQIMGERNNYDAAFIADGNYDGWKTKDLFHPKYPIAPKRANYMFMTSRLPYEAIATIDFSQCKNFFGTFHMYQSKKLPPIDLRLAEDTTHAFSNSDVLEEIEKVMVSENTVFSSSVFVGITKLKEIRFEGTIGPGKDNMYKTLSFASCTNLSKQSISSVISCLSNATSGLAVTFSKAAVNKAFETSEGANDGENSAAWEALTASASNWTISLA